MHIQRTSIKRKQGAIAPVLYSIIFGFGTASAEMIDNGNGTVTDTDSGLMWVQDADMMGQQQWSAMDSAVSGLTYAGYDDWRLPTVDEMSALYAHLSQSESFDPSPFLNLAIDGLTDYYWSSQQDGQICYWSQCVDAAWYFDFSIAGSGRVQANYSFNGFPVRNAPADSGPYVLQENVAPGAKVTASYEHNTLGTGLTPYYGYYTTEFPSLNDNGVIVARTDRAHASDPMVTADSGEAAKWIDGQIVHLGVVGCKDENQDGIADNTSCGSRALAINNDGLVSGSSHNWVPAQDTYFEKAYVFSPDGPFAPFRNTHSQAQVEDVTENGAFTGTGITNGGAAPYDGMEHGMLVTSDGRQIVIGTTYQRSRAHAANEFDMVTGAMFFDPDHSFENGDYNARPWQAYRWNGRVLWGGFLPGGDYSEGYDLNNDGVVVGRAETADGVQHAFMWDSRNDYLSQDRDGNFTNLAAELHSFLVDLGTLTGNPLHESTARSINDVGQIVGWSDSAAGKHAFLYDQGVMHDLNELFNTNGWELVDAYAINENGQILARGTKNSVDAYVVVSPTGAYPTVNIVKWDDPALDPEMEINPVTPQIGGPDVGERELVADVFVCKFDCPVELGGNYYTTIQAGVDAASAGQTIMVLPGTYEEAVNIDDNKLLISWKGPGETIIDAHGTDTAAVYAYNASIDGFTVTGGAGSLSASGSRAGGGIMANARNATVYVKNNVLINNTANGQTCTSTTCRPAGNGGGIYASRSNYSSGALIISHNLVANNEANYGAAGIHCTRSCTLEGNLVHDNEGDGVYFFGTLKTTVVANNTGDGVLMSGSSVIANSLIVGNTGTAVDAYKYSGTLVPAKIVNSTIAYNAPGLNQYAIKGISSYGLIQNSILWANSRYKNPYNTGSPSYDKQTTEATPIVYSIVDGGHGGDASTVSEQNPLFVNAKNGFFDLQPGSPAIDAGADATAYGVTDDLYGVTRPVDGDGLGVGSTGDGSDFDIGTFEYAP